MSKTIPVKIEATGQSTVDSATAALDRLEKKVAALARTAAATAPATRRVNDELKALLSAQTGRQDAFGGMTSSLEKLQTEISKIGRSQGVSALKGRLNDLQKDLKSFENTGIASIDAVKKINKDLDTALGAVGGVIPKRKFNVFLDLAKEVEASGKVAQAAVIAESLKIEKAVNAAADRAALSDSKNMAWHGKMQTGALKYAEGLVKASAIEDNARLGYKIKMQAGSLKLQEDLDRIAAVEAAKTLQRALKAADLNAQFQGMSPQGQLKRATRVAGVLSSGISEAEAVSKFGTEALRGAQSLGALQAAAARLPAPIKETSGHLLHMNSVMAQGHSLARGLASGFNAMWLTWGSLAPLLAGAAISASFVKALKAGSAVAENLADIRELAGATTPEIAQMSAAMSKLGETSAYGPIETSKALKILSLAGLDAKDSMLALKPTLDFAMAGGVATERAAETLVAVATAYGYSADQMSVVGDVIAKTAAVSMTSVEKMSESFKVASSVAQQFHVTLQDSALNLAFLSQIGITGTAAGTAMTNFYQYMVAGSGPAQKALKAVGLEMLDLTTGKVKPYMQMIAELDGVLSKKTYKEQQHLMTLMTTNRGMKDAAAALVAYRTEVKLLDPVQAQKIEQLNASSKAVDKEAASVLQAALTMTQAKRMQQQLADAPGFTAIAAAGKSLTPENQMKGIKAALENDLVKAFEKVSDTLYIVGARLRETLNSEEFRNAISGMVRMVASFVEGLVSLASWLSKNSDFLRGMMTAVAVGASALVAATAVHAAFATSVAGASIATFSFSGALGKAVVAVRALSLAILTTPAGWAIMAAAVIAGGAAYLLFGRDAKAGLTKAQEAEQELSKANKLRNRDFMTSIEASLQGYKDRAEAAKGLRTVEEIQATRALSEFNARADQSTALATLEIANVAAVALAKSVAAGESKEAQAKVAAGFIKQMDMVALANELYKKQAKDAVNELKESAKAEAARTKSPKLPKGTGTVGGSEDHKEQAKKLYEDLAGAMRKVAEATDIELGNAQKLSESDKFRISNLEAIDKALRDKRITLDQAVDLEEKMHNIEGQIELNTQLKAQQKLYEENTAERAKHTATNVEGLAKLEEEIKKQETHNAQLGLTKEAIAAVDAANIELQATKLESLAVDDLVQRQDTVNYGLQMTRASALRKLAAAKLVGGAKEEKADIAKEASKDLAALLDPTKAQSFGDALSGAFNKAGGALGKLTSTLQAYGTTQARIDKARRTASVDYAGDSKKFASVSADLTEKEASARIEAYGSMAGAAKDFFDESSDGYRLLNGIEKAMHLMQMANMAEKLFTSLFVTTAQVTGNAAVATSAVTSAAIQVPANLAVAGSSALGAVANQGNGDPYSAFPRIAAMIGIMAGLGLLMGGGGGGAPSVSKDAFAGQKANEGMGTVLGDPTAQSESIKNSLAALESMAEPGLAYTAQMVILLQGIKNSLAGATSSLVASGFDASGSGFQGSESAGGNWLFGKNSSSTSLADVGLSFAKQTIDEAMRSVELQKYQVTRTDSSSSGFLGFGGSSSTSYDTQMAGIDAKVSRSMTLAMQQMFSLVSKANGQIGGSQSQLDALRTLDSGLGKVSLKGKTGAEIQAELTAIFSAMGDTMARAVAPGIADLQKAGEGYLETLVRVTNGLSIVNVWAERFGHTLYTVSIEGARASDKLAKAFGGMDKLVSASQKFYDTYYSEEERAARSQVEIAKSLAAVNLQMPTSKEGFRELVLEMYKMGDAGIDAYVTLLTVGTEFATMTDTIAKLSGNLVKATLQEMQEAAKSLPKNSNLNADVSKSGMSDFTKYFSESLNLLSSATIFDGSINALKDLSSESTRMYQSALSLVLQIAQAAKSASASFEASKRSIKLDVLDTEGKYAFFDSEIARYTDVLKSLTDPSAIADYSARIENAITSGWGLLSEEQKMGTSDKFLTLLSNADDLTKGRFQAATDMTLAQAGAANQAVANAISAAITATLEKEAAARETRAAAQHIAALAAAEAMRVAAIAVAAAAVRAEAAAEAQRAAAAATAAAAAKAASEVNWYSNLDPTARFA